MSFRGTKRAAEREFARLVVELGGSLSPAAPDEPEWGPDTTVNDAIVAWKANGWADLSPTTRPRHESAWATHIRDSIGRRPISSLTPYQVERFHRSVKESGLSEGSVRYVRALVHRASRLARTWSGNRLPNPFVDAELPEWPITERARPVRAPSGDEVLALLDGARDFDLRVATFLRLRTHRESSVPRCQSPDVPVPSSRQQSR